MSLMTRQDLIVQSAQDFMRHGLFDLRGLDPTQVELLDAFDYEWVQEHQTGLDKDYIASGFNFDDGGKGLEMGSSLRSRNYTMEVLAFATTPDRGENLNAHLTFLWEQDPMLLPLLDYRQAQSSDSYPMYPEIDRLVVLDARGMRLAHPAPEPWQRNTWQVMVRLYDEYDGSLW